MSSPGGNRNNAGMNDIPDAFRPQQGRGDQSGGEPIRLDDRTRKVLLCDWSFY